MEPDQGSGDRPLGRLPDGGQPVDDLMLTKTSNRSSMTFSQSGIDIQIAYTVTDTDDCYHFVVETADSPITGNHCR